MTVQDVLALRAPRRLLALDGGGIRGLITIEVLAKIEAIVRQNTAADAVLADYFDYIAGTSTGAIIAASLSIGMSVAAIRDFYLQTGPAMFDAASWLRRFNYKPS
jgi:patatin-like phospholipase/acyl hydrolase